MPGRLPDGVWPVLLTPFKPDRTIDWAVLDRLTDWQIEAGVAGLFVTALSAEVLYLTDEEKLAIASTVVRRVRGRLPIVSAAYTPGIVDEQISLLQRLAGTGVDGVVITACQIVPREDSAEQWRRQMQRVIDATGEIALGLYEMPVPYHRLLAADELRWAARTRRFVFHKDTSCDIGRIREKLSAVQGTPLGFYNANTPTLLDSLRSGGNGYSGIGANYFPELYVHLCRAAPEDSAKAGHLQDFLTSVDALCHHKYPAAAKTLLRLRGMPIEPICRASDATLGETETAELNTLFRSAVELAERLHLPRFDLPM